jgi:von Willebrand factor type A domain
MLRICMLLAATSLALGADTQTQHDRSTTSSAKVRSSFVRQVFYVNQTHLIPPSTTSLSLSLVCHQHTLESTAVVNHRRRLQSEEPTGVQITTPPSVSLEEPFTVTITVQGAGGETSRSFPIDVVFAIDSSGSMVDSDPTDLRLEAAKQFVDKLDADIDAGSVVSWNNEIELVFPTVGLTNDFVALKANIDLARTDVFGGTKLDLGLQRAIVALDENTRSPPFDAVIIFLTDGNGEYTPSTQPGSWTTVAAHNRYKIYSIGLGNDVRTENLEDMAAATGGMYYPSPSADNIQNIFAEIFQRVVLSTVPYNINLITQSMSYIGIDESAISPPPDTISVNETDGTTTLTWAEVDGGNGLPSGQSRVFTYTASSSLAGINLPVDMVTRSSFTDMNGENEGLTEFLPAIINVVQPTKGIGNGKGYVTKGKGFVTVKGQNKKTKGGYHHFAQKGHYFWETTNWETTKGKGKGHYVPETKGKGVHHVATPSAPTFQTLPTLLLPYFPILGGMSPAAEEDAPVAPPVVLPPVTAPIASKGKGKKKGSKGGTTTSHKISYMKKMKKGDGVSGGGGGGGGGKGKGKKGEDQTVTMKMKMR